MKMKMNALPERLKELVLKYITYFYFDCIISLDFQRIDSNLLIPSYLNIEVSAFEVNQPT